jgi:hypothetical protein
VISSSISKNLGKSLKSKSIKSLGKKFVFKNRISYKYFKVIEDQTQDTRKANNSRRFCNGMYSKRNKSRYSYSSRSDVSDQVNSHLHLEPSNILPSSSHSSHMSSTSFISEVSDQNLNQPCLKSESNFCYYKKSISISEQSQQNIGQIEDSNKDINFITKSSSNNCKNNSVIFRNLNETTLVSKNVASDNENVISFNTNSNNINNNENYERFQQFQINHQPAKPNQINSLNANSNSSFVNPSSYLSHLHHTNQNFNYDVEMNPLVRNNNQNSCNNTQINSQNGQVDDNQASSVFNHPLLTNSENNFFIDINRSQTFILNNLNNIKQDLLKMSYEKFKQFRLNEKLLQQTVLIRNAIKMLQYDIQLQQEQEQHINLIHQHQQNVLQPMDYIINESNQSNSNSISSRFNNENTSNRHQNSQHQSETFMVSSSSHQLSGSLVQSHYPNANTQINHNMFTMNSYDNLEDLFSRSDIIINHENYNHSANYSNLCSNNMNISNHHETNLNYNNAMNGCSNLTNYFMNTNDHSIKLNDNKHLSTNGIMGNNYQLDSFNDYQDEDEDEESEDDEENGTDETFDEEDGDNNDEEIDDADDLEDEEDKEDLDDNENNNDDDNDEDEDDVNIKETDDIDGDEFNHQNEENNIDYQDDVDAGYGEDNLSENGFVSDTNNGSLEEKKINEDSIQHQNEVKTIEIGNLK